MRSVFVLLRGTTETEVAAFLDRTYPSELAPPWVLRGEDGPSLYINFHGEFCDELETPERVNVNRQFSGEPAVVVMADVSGRIPGDEQAFEFVTCMLDHFSGAAMDEYTDHLWSLAELRADLRVAGHRFFDSQG